MCSQFLETVLLPTAVFPSAYGKVELWRVLIPQFKNDGRTANWLPNVVFIAIFNASIKFFMPAIVISFCHSNRSHDHVNG